MSRPDQIEYQKGLGKEFGTLFELKARLGVSLQELAFEAGRLVGESGERCESIEYGYEPTSEGATEDARAVFRVFS